VFPLWRNWIVIRIAHGALMGEKKIELQDVAYVLGFLEKGLLI
jgi:hypothetical protein